METNDKGTDEERRWGLMGLLLRAEGKARALDPAIADKLAAVRVEIAEALEDPNPRFRFNDDGTISADHQSAGVIGAILARSAQHGMNYVSMEAYDDELGSLVITVQRKWKVTPHGARQAAEALARDLAARLAKHGEVVDLPLALDVADRLVVLDGRVAVGVGRDGDGDRLVGHVWPPLGVDVRRRGTASTPTLGSHRARAHHAHHVMCRKRADGRPRPPMRRMVDP